mgnify:CR=1 FL=1
MMMKVRGKEIMVGLYGYLCLDRKCDIKTSIEYYSLLKANIRHQNVIFLKGSFILKDERQFRPSFTTKVKPNRSSGK